MRRILAPDSFRTARLRLRRSNVSDADAIFEYGSDPEVAHYADWVVRSSIDSLIKSLSNTSNRWVEGQSYSWVITLPVDDKAIGGISCELRENSAEIGFLLHRSHWSKGYATEAAQVVIEWLKVEPYVAKIWATCDTENAASIQVLWKLGMTLEKTLPNAIVRPQISPEPRDCLLFSIMI